VVGFDVQALWRVGLRVCGECLMLECHCEVRLKAVQLRSKWTVGATFGHRLMHGWPSPLTPYDMYTSRQCKVPLMLLGVPRGARMPLSIGSSKH